ncbi:MAG: hypothetical protein EOO02_13970 [Chitinophagaceae bacterium]|nr:MAG: hypothetical protein EOO02_13970 [Chitinophagaceae bacterium]
MIHNRSEVFGELTIRVPNGKGKLTISAAGWPHGLATISVFSAKGLLKIQTLINLGSVSYPKVSIKTDSLVYLTGSRVIVKVNLRRADGGPLRGIFSLASVMKKTADARKSDIRDYINVDRHIYQQRILPEPGFLDRVWRSESLLPAISSPRANHYQIDTSSIDGVVTRYGKRIRKPVEVMIAGETVTFTKTDAQGNFRFPPEAYYGRFRSKLLVSVVGVSGGTYSVTVFDKAKILNDSIANHFYSGHLYRKDEMTAQEKEQLRQLQGQLLEQVVVKANRGRTIYTGTFDSRSCDDYVCMNNIFNCANHPRGSAGTMPAIDGETYIIGGIYKQYHCLAQQQKGIGLINATWYNQPFAAIVPGDSVSPELYKRTTLFWAPEVQTDENGNAEVSFYTNDVKGNFIAEVQGVTAEGVFSKRVEFVVAEDKKNRK